MTQHDTYPPEQHLLRDLRFSFEHEVDARTSRAWMPVVPELCTDQGHARAGALATLVDVIGGGLAASAAAPDWIATADLTLHLVRGAPAGSTVEARAAVLRKGRTTVVMDVQLVDETERELGIATMSFSVLPRRDINPSIEAVRGSGPSTMALDDSRLRVPLPEALAIEVRDAAHGELDVPVTDWGRNSMGAMQGGVVAMVVELAAETALRSAARSAGREVSGMPLVIADLELTYLGFGRVGPIRTHVDVLGTDAAHVELVDTGADPRRMTVARRDRDSGARMTHDSPFVAGPAKGREVGRYVGLDLRETEEGRLRGVAPIREHLRGPEGGMRPGPLLTLLDSVGGLNAGLASLPDGWVVSTNLAARFVSHEHVGPLVLESDVLRKGRNSVITSVTARDDGAGGVVVADGVLTSAVLIPENGPPSWVRPVVLKALELPDEGYPRVAGWLATRAVDAITLEMDLHESMRNPWGILHGGVVAMLIDLAVEHATGAIPASVIVHFFAPNRVGPVRATARSVGARVDGEVLRVEVRDIGADRLTALAIATIRL